MLVNLILFSLKQKIIVESINLKKASCLRYLWKISRNFLKWTKNYSTMKINSHGLLNCFSTIQNERLLLTSASFNEFTWPYFEILACKRPYLTIQSLNTDLFLSLIGIPSQNCCCWLLLLIWIEYWRIIYNVNVWCIPKTV